MARVTGCRSAGEYQGVVELVILNVGLDLHILSPELFSMMVIMALATTMMTTPLIDRILPPSP